MNWNNIKEKYPKARELLSKYLSGRAEYCFEWNTRALYDFFDEQGIYISLHHLEDEFVYEIEDGKDLNSSGEYESTRTEAETRAFEKAFEILENK